VEDMVETSTDLNNNNNNRITPLSSNTAGAILSRVTRNKAMASPSMAEVMAGEADTEEVTSSKDRRNLVESAPREELHWVLVVV